MDLCGRAVPGRHPFRCGGTPAPPRAASPRLRQPRPRPSGHERWHQAAERFNEAEGNFRRPYEEALAVVRRGDASGDASGDQRLVDFLQADPWCFGSGYLKADDVMHALANRSSLLNEPQRRRLKGVVLMRLADPQPRLDRHTDRLAAALWDDELALEIQRLRRKGDARQRGVIDRTLLLVDNRRRSQAANPQRGSSLRTMLPLCATSPRPY